MGVNFNSFYKVIVMRVDVFESEIVDEKHFGTLEDAASFCDHVMNTSDNMTFMVKM